MLDKLTIDDFRKAIHDQFRLETGDGTSLDLVLVEVLKTTEREPGKDERIPFSAEFRGPKTPILAQRIYALENRRMGRLEIFLVPIGPDSQGMLYEAVFT